MEELLKQILGELKTLKSDIQDIKQTVSIKEELSEVKHSVYGLETQLIETNQIARNIEHATATTAAQLDGINYNAC